VPTLNPFFIGSFTIFIIDFIEVFMARPIKETPTIKGKDSIRFQEAMDNLVPASAEEKERMKRSYEFMKSIAAFPMP
jgi:hypothetical protein